MRIELDKALTKTKLRQALKMMGGDIKQIKIIMGTEIFDIDTIVSENGVMYLCTDSEETANFYNKRVIEDLPVEEEDVNDLYKPVYYYIKNDNEWVEKWEEYRKKHGLPKYYIGDTPGFDYPGKLISYNYNTEEE